MATARRSRTIAAAPEKVWVVIEDPHHMPRWWPGVARMEGVDAERFTQVHLTKKGKPVRVDFSVLVSEGPWRRIWEQEIPGTPFERVLSASVIEIALEPQDGATKVTLEQRQKLRGYSRTGAFLLRRATRQRLDEALDGLARIFS
ncbi:MAG: SRPBCC family protein [Solirubrobacteraceae bacterium]